MPELNRFRVYRVLLVEDDEPFAKMLLTALNRYNFFVRYAGDGRYALKFLKEEPFDLMLCDISMPHIDGFKLLETSQTQRLKMPPVLMLTGSKDRDTVIKAKAMGAAGFIGKPVPMRQLLGKIKETLNLTDDMLLDKTTAPFKVNCRREDSELLVFISGCPVKTPLPEIKQAILETQPLMSRVTEALIHVNPEFACEGRAVEILDDIAKYLNKQLRVTVRSIRFIGRFFDALPVLEREKFRKQHTVLDMAADD